MIFIVEEKDLKIARGYSVLYFYAPWLSCHREMLGYMKVAEENHPDVKFYGIDVDIFKSLIDRFEIFTLLCPSLPAVVITREKSRIARHLIGAKWVAMIDAKLTKRINGTANKEVDDV